MGTRARRSAETNSSGGELKFERFVASGRPDRGHVTAPRDDVPPETRDRFRAALISRYGHPVTPPESPRDLG